MFDALDELSHSLQSVQRVKKLLRDYLNPGIRAIDTSSDTLCEPAVGFLSTLRGQREQIIRNGHQNSNEDIICEKSCSGITGSNQLAFFVAIIDEAGHGCLAKTLFARPSVVLSTNP